jgi:hypothetical protein
MTRSLTVLPAQCERRVIDAIAWPQSVRLAPWPTVRFATTTVTTVAPLTTIATTQKRHHLAWSRRLPLLAVWGSGSRGGVLVERLQAGRRSPFIHRQ